MNGAKICDGKGLIRERPGFVGCNGLTSLIKCYGRPDVAEWYCSKCHASYRVSAADSALVHQMPSRQPQRGQGVPQ
jgi:hypothetical protein